MKRLLFSLFTILVGVTATIASEPAPGIVAPLEPLFRAHELEFGIFWAGAFGKVDYQDHVGTHTQTTTVTQTHVVTHTITIPGDDEQNVTKIIKNTVTETKSASRTTTFKYRQTSHQGYGGGVETNYFFTRYLGIGVEGDWLSADSAISAFGGSFIARYPFERGAWAIAPYAFAGGGAQFDGLNVGYGYVGGGFEVRFSPKWGLFADGRWTVHNNDLNYALVRAGVRMVF